MMLMAIVLPPVMTGISLSLSAGAWAKQQAQACSLGHGKLAELVAQGQWQHTAMAGDFGSDWPQYQWTAKVSDFDGSMLRQVDLTVLWHSGLKERSVTFSTLVCTGGTQ